MLWVRTAVRATRSPLLAARSSITRPALRISQPLVANRSYHEKDKHNQLLLADQRTNYRKDMSVGTALVGAPACGDVIRLDIKVDEKTGVITESRFKTFGCGSAIASSSYLTTLVQGMTLDEASKIKNVDISSELCLPPVKLHCSLLAEDAIKAAIKNYKSKRSTAPTDLAGTGKGFTEKVAEATA